MLEIVALVCAIAATIWTPMETTKVIGGWVNKRFKGDHAAFLKAYRKQLGFLRIAGLVLFVLMGAFAVYSFVDEHDALRGGIKAFSAVVWGAAGLVGMSSRNRLDAAMAAGQIPMTAPATPAA